MVAMIRCGDSMRPPCLTARKFCELDRLYQIEIWAELDTVERWELEYSADNMHQTLWIQSIRKQCIRQFKEYRTRQEIFYEKHWKIRNSGNGVPSKFSKILPNQGGNMKTIFEVVSSTRMAMSEKKDRVLNYLQAAKIYDINNFFDFGWRSPTEIGREALGASYENASSKACPVLSELVREGLVERQKPGLYRLKG